ncbi:hypothetical protein SteCoe_9763 [Stentor coeruleus]|uniref:Uncharacterized protein n=1 Tax=Stentor coeruleus TaxID=5963 RepID=A0A1R2CH79_9CILI|nr:hypothetical protein SteCoe_9763 [Stentor coeruleus]
MGCCESKNNLESQLSSKTIFEIIRRKNLKVLQKLISSNEFNIKKQHYISMLDNETAKYSTISINALAYALMIGDVNIFITLHKLGCSLLAMENNLKEQGVSILDVLCIKGHSSILSYYLPLFLADLGSSSPRHLEKLPNATLDTEFNPFPEQNYTPIQLATIFEYIQVVTVISEFTKNLIKSPEYFDLDYKETITGLSCPLLAVKYGNFAMVKYLHCNYNCDFHAVDENGLNAVEIAVNEVKSRPHRPYLKIICFLIDIVGVKVDNVLDKIMYKNDDPKLQEYFKMKAKKGKEDRVQREDEKEGTFEYITLPLNVDSIISVATEVKKISGASISEFLN